MKPYLLGFILSLCLGACSSPNANVRSAASPENTVRMVGGKVIEILGPLAFKADGDLSPLGQDIERTIELWGVKQTTSDLTEEELVEFLRAHLVRNGARVFCTERIKLSETRSSAECRMSEITVQEELLNRGFVSEDCTLTKNRYETCG